MRLLYSATSSSVSATIMTLWILSRLNNERRTWYLGYYGLLLAGVRERCKKTKQKETDNVSFKYACEAKITEDLAFKIGYEWRNKSKMLVFIIVYECVKSKITSFLLFLRTFPLWVYKIPFEGTGLIYENNIQRLTIKLLQMSYSGSFMCTPFWKGSCIKLFGLP